MDNTLEENNLSLIKEIIKKRYSSLRDFADKNEIRRSTLYDFLNGVLDIRLSSLMAILEPLKLTIIDLIVEDNEPEFVMGLFLNEKAYFEVGDTFQGETITSLFLDEKKNFLCVVTNIRTDSKLTILNPRKADLSKWARKLK